MRRFFGVLVGSTRSWHLTLGNANVSLSRNRVTANLREAARGDPNGGTLTAVGSPIGVGVVAGFQIWAAVGYNWRSPIVFFPLHDVTLVIHSK